MGLLIDGEWHDQWYDTTSADGRFRREEASFPGWLCADDGPGPDGQPGHRAEPGRYRLSRRIRTGRVMVPMLWDTATDSVVSNESSEIIRMFNSAYDGLGAKPGDYYPAALRGDIDAMNDRVYDTVNNGVYKAPGVAETVHYDHIKRHYYESHPTINPTGIVPLGPLQPY